MSKKLLTDNAQAFKSKSTVAFCEKNGIILKHLTPYYPHGNGLAESTNKSIIQSIKKLLKENKRSQYSMLKYALQADIITIKKAIGTSPFQLVYGTDVVFLVQLGIPVMKFLHDSQEEPNDIQRRIYALIELQQKHETVQEKAQLYRTKVKERFDRKIKENTFSNGDMVLRWDARKEQKGKHGKFDNIWFGPFIVSNILENNTFVLQTLDGEELSNPINGHFLKHVYIF